jgi:hypothetical protein
MRVRPHVLGPLLFAVTFAAVSAYRISDRGRDSSAAEAVRALALAQGQAPTKSVSQQLLAGREFTPLDKLALSEPGAAALKRAISSQLGLMTVRSRCMAGLATPYTDLELNLEVETRDQVLVVRALDVVVSKGAPIPAPTLECLKQELAEVRFPSRSDQRLFPYAGAAKQHVIFRN